MIMDLGLPEKDIERMAAFMQSGGEELPKLRSTRSRKILYTMGETPEEAIINHPCWRLVMGCFVERDEECEDSELFANAKGSAAGYGIVEEGYENPTGVYMVGDTWCHEKHEE